MLGNVSQSIHEVFFYFIVYFKIIEWYEQEVFIKQFSFKVELIFGFKEKSSEIIFVCFEECYNFEF